MKKILVFVLIAIIIISVTDIEPAYADGSVTITYVMGPKKLKVGESAVYCFNVSYTNCYKIYIYINSTGDKVIGSGATICQYESYEEINTSNSHSLAIRVKGVSSGTAYVSVVFIGRSKNEGNSYTDLYETDGIQITVYDSTPTPAATAPPAPAGTAAPTAKPGSSQNTNPTPTPNINELKDWGQVHYMMSHSGGDDISFDMSKYKHDIPRNVLGLLKGQSSCLTVNFGEYECMLDGSKIEDLDKKLKKLDLSFSTKNSKTLSTLLGGVDAFQFHFNHDGAPIPCPIAYKVQADGYKKGDELYLYYHNEKDKCLEAISSHTVDKDGYISFEVPHFSSYALASEVIDSAQNNSVLYTPTPVPTDTPAPTDSPSPTPTEKPTYTPAPTHTPSPIPTEKADDKNTSNTLLIILIIGVFLSIVFFVAVLLWYGKDKKKK